MKLKGHYDNKIICHKIICHKPLFDPKACMTKESHCLAYYGLVTLYNELVKSNY